MEKIDNPTILETKKTQDKNSHLIEDAKSIVQDEIEHLSYLDEKSFDNHLKEVIFKTLVESHVLEGFEESMEKKGYSSEDLDSFRKGLAQYSVEQKMQILSLPFELREKFLTGFKDQLEKGKYSSAEEIASILLNLAEKNDAMIGYHGSNELHTHKTQRMGSVVSDSWIVPGTEKDHRNEDYQMAYYSSNYQDLYRDKNPRYLYFVRSLRKGGGHFQDNNKSWGRAQTLSVIDMIDFRELDNEVRELFLEMKEIFPNQEKNKKIKQN
ncbi:MAG: hypothetical protein WC795_01425 [Candidatus Paceibacterota bacterium]|jgi:hypothetical protein